MSQNINENPVNDLSTHSKVYPMYKEIQISLQFEELRAVVKSLSIGCDQLSRKLDRLSSSKYSKDTQEELLVLMQANNKMQDALAEVIEGSF
jgi:hypothetical protein